MGDYSDVSLEKSSDGVGMTLLSWYHSTVTARDGLVSVVPVVGKGTVYGFLPLQVPSYN